MSILRYPHKRMGINIGCIYYYPLACADFYPQFRQPKKLIPLKLSDS